MNLQQEVAAFCNSWIEWFCEEKTQLKKIVKGGNEFGNSTKSWLRWEAIAKCKIELVCNLVLGETVKTGIAPQRKDLKNMPATGPLNPKYKYLEIPHRMRPIWMDGEAESKMLYQ